MFYPAFLRKLYNPPEFQGNLKKRSYFEGWYLKHVAADLSHSISFIPGISLSGDPHSFIQILDGITGESHYIRYNLDEFAPVKGRFGVEVGKSFFSGQYSDINISGDGFTASGRIEYHDNNPWPGSLFNPGIMGWYSFVPFMECKHGVVSMNHSITGDLELNDRKIDFAGGKGYIEKDWGSSFPESWIWIQCNHFDIGEASFMLSVAKIPWLGKYFIGFLGFLWKDGQLFRFSTYNRSGITKLEEGKDILEIAIHHKSFSINALIYSSKFGELKAPRLGLMDRYIKESIDSSLDIRLEDKKENSILLLKGKRAGLEIVGDLETLREIVE